MERFQFVYGWLTSWEKTTAHILNYPGDVPKSISLPSITNSPGVDPWTITEHEVSVSSNEFNFLRAQVDDPGARVLELFALVDAFVFPSFSLRTPFSLLRKLVSQNLISKCRALLSLQPISDAEPFMLISGSQDVSMIHLVSHFALTTPYPPCRLTLVDFNFPPLHVSMQVLLSMAWHEI